MTDLAQLAKTAEDDLEVLGWSVVEFDFSDGSGTDGLVRFAELFGTASDRDGGPIWPIRACRAEGTFSVRTGSAPLHTDAQYRADPEPRFILFCIRPAKFGGESTVVALEDLLEDLDSDGAGTDLIATLEAPEWRWRVPVVFQEPGEPTVSEPQPVLTQGAVRWRADNLVVDESLRPVVKRLEAIASECRAKRIVSLAPGQALICDNQRVLHGRLPFSDPDRLLYRVRLT